MVLPLVLDLAAVPASEDLARGEAEFLRGNTHCDAREFVEALACYDRAAAFGYEDHVMWNNRGVALDGLGRHEDAIDAYTRAMRRSPTYEVAAYNLGNAFAQLGQFEEAVVAYDRALAIKPDYADALYDKALVLARMGRGKAAWNNKGFTFFMLGIHEEALACYERALAINPAYKQAWYNKGYTFHGINRLEDAVTAYEKAIELDQQDEVLWNNLGNALYNLGRYERSIPYFERALEVNPNYDHAWMAKAESRHHLGRLEEARDALNNALILNGAFDEAWVFRGLILEEMGNAFEAERCYEEALQCFRASLELEPENAELRYNQGVLLEDLERVEEAIDAYAGAASRTHGADALVRLSALLLRVGRAADALAPAEDVCSRHPTDSRGWLAAGRASSALGRDAEAEAAFQKAVELGAAEGRLELARTLRHLGRASDAMTILDGMESSDTEASLLRADLHEDLGRAEDALSDCDAALRISAEGRDVVYRRKGGLLLRLDRPKEALAAFDAALGLNPTDPEAWCDAARAWRALGQESRARKMLDQALRLDPGFPRALDLRAEPTASS